MDQRRELLFDAYSDLVCSISPIEFEQVCLDALRAYAEKETLPDFNIEHNVKVPASDGIYQIDIFADFKALGTTIKVVVECKQYKRPVSRDKVETLYSRVNSLGANKGILMSTSGFQSGAIQFAKAHGIALLQVFDNHIKFMSNSAGNRDLFDALHREYYRRYPKYVVQEWSEDGPFTDIYPSKKMVIKLQKEAMKSVLET